MLYIYQNKVYIRPISNELVEVNVKKDKEFNVIPTSTKIELTNGISKKLSEISLDEAYKMQNKKNIL